MALDKFSLERVFASWKQQNGESVVGRGGTEYFRVPYTSSLRRPMLSILFHTLIEEHGYKIEDFGTLFVSYLKDTCANPDMEDKKKLASIKSQIDWDVTYVLAEIFPNSKPKNAGKTYDGKIPEKPKVAEDGDYEPNPLDITKLKGVIMPASVPDPDFDILADIEDET